MTRLIRLQQLPLSSWKCWTKEEERSNRTPWSLSDFLNESDKCDTWLFRVRQRTPRSGRSPWSCLVLARWLREVRHPRKQKCAWSWEVFLKCRLWARNNELRPRPNPGESQSASMCSGLVVSNSGSEGPRWKLVGLLYLRDSRWKWNKRYYVISTVVFPDISFQIIKSPHRCVTFNIRTNRPMS